MAVIADTHVHIYPCHNRGRLLSALARNLAGLDATATRVAFLVDGAGCTGFPDLMRADPDSGDVPTVRRTGDEACLALGWGDGAPLYVFRGRQIVTSERVEILAVLSSPRVADGMPAADTVAAVLEGGGIPILAWAPGKWLFRRAAVVRDLLGRFPPTDLLLGDSSLRPWLWPTPGPMKRAARRGYRCVAGSDPLPFAAEESQAGRYATRIDGEFDPARPAESLRRVLSSEAGHLRRVGSRSGVIEMALRLLRNAGAKKHAA